MTAPAVNVAPVEAIVALTEASVDYPGRGRALGPISLQVAPGEILALVGASGCGKSTALRLLAGLEQPTGGETRRRVQRGETALVFQAPTLMPWADARSNVSLPLKLMGVDAEKADERAAAALQRVGLAGAQAARPAELSGGMAMRVSLARALVTAPRLLLMDEPFAALDSLTRRRLIEDIHAVWAASPVTMVLVTHDLEDALYFASRVIALTAAPGRIAGQVQAAGPIPRPAGFRTSEAFAAAANQLGAILEHSLKEAP